MTTTTHTEDRVVCPKCSSTQIHIDKKATVQLKAVAGSLLVVRLVFVRTIRTNKIERPVWTAIINGPDRPVKITAYHLGCHGIPEDAWSSMAGACIYVQDVQVQYRSYHSIGDGHCPDHSCLVGFIANAGSHDDRLEPANICQYTFQQYQKADHGNSGRHRVGLMIWTGLMLLISYLTRLFY